jgi:MerR family gold-responsive transcriptional activator of gol and ges genes
MADALRRLASACDGDGRPDCPIIQGLAAPASAEPGEPPPACHAGGATPRAPR